MRHSSLLSYRDMVDTYLEASEGKESPNEIQVSRMTLKEILDRIYDPWIDVMARKNRINELEWYREVFAGRLPLLFMGAHIVRRDIPDSEIRFINETRPDLNKVLTFDYKQESAA